MKSPLELTEESFQPARLTELLNRDDWVPEMVNFAKQITDQLHNTGLFVEEALAVLYIAHVNILGRHVECAEFQKAFAARVRFEFASKAVLIDIEEPSRVTA